MNLLACPEYAGRTAAPRAGSVAGSFPPGPGVAAETVFAGRIAVRAPLSPGLCAPANGRQCERCGVHLSSRRVLRGATFSQGLPSNTTAMALAGLGKSSLGGPSQPTAVRRAAAKKGGMRNE